MQKRSKKNEKMMKENEKKEIKGKTKNHDERKNN